MRVWALGLSCETPAAPPDRAAGARTRQPKNSKRAHLRVLAFRNTTKIQREDTQREKKRTNFVAGEGKKREKLWAPTLRGSTLRAPHPSGPFGAPPVDSPPFGAPPFGAPPCLAWLKPFLARKLCCCLTQGEFCVTFPFVPYQDVASCHAKDGGLWRRLRSGTR